MPISISWGDPEHTILLITAEGRWNWDEFYATLETGRAMRGRHDVDIVFDLQHAHMLPEGALANFGSVLRRVRPSSEGAARHLILVNANAIYRSILEILERVSPSLAHRLYFVSNIHDAYTLSASLRLGQTEPLA